jgi:hypothetical protein
VLVGDFGQTRGQIIGSDADIYLANAVGINPDGAGARSRAHPQSQGALLCNVAGGPVADGQVGGQRQACDLVVQVGPGPGQRQKFYEDGLGQRCRTGGLRTSAARGAKSECHA